MMRPEVWETIKKTFDEISDSSPEIRERVLNLQDDDVRRELERMLASHDESALSDASDTLFPDARLVTKVLGEARAFDEGEILLDRFRIVKFLGSGGMGEVYAAKDKETGDVALKTLRPEFATLESTLESFRRELMRGRKVSHPNVCGIYDLFSADAGRTRIPFFTMELLDGETLSKRVATEGPLEESQALRIALQICDGLQAAHDEGVIHGDLKGSNILICQDHEGTPRAKITDFGLARLARGQEAGELRPGGLPAGTKQFLPLEVIEGHPTAIASDLFALGVVLFHMRTGQYWFDPDGDWDATKAARKSPPSLEELAPLVGRTWAGAISSCLATDPLDRPASAKQVREALCEPASETKKPILTRRQMLGAAGASGLGVAATVAWLWQRNRPAPNLPAGKIRTLVEEFASAGAPPAIASAVRSLFVSALHSSRRIEVIQPAEVRSALLALGLGEQALRGNTAQSVAARTSARIVISGAVAEAPGGYQLSMRALDPVSSGAPLLSEQTVHSKVADLPKVVSEMCRTLRTRVGGDVATAQFDLGIPEQADTSRADALESFALGLSLYNNGDPDAALAKLTEATQLDPDFAMAYAYQAVVDLAYRRKEMAIAPVSRAFELRDRLNPHHRLYVEYLYLIVLGDYENAHRRLSSLQQLFPTDPTLNRNLAQSAALLGRPELGLTYARKAAELDPDNPLNLDLFASALAENGRESEAEQALSAALARSPEAQTLLFCKAYLELLRLDHQAAVSTLNRLKTSAIASLSEPQKVKALYLGGRFEEARSLIAPAISPIPAQAADTLAHIHRYWLGQIAALHGDFVLVESLAGILCNVNPSPTALGPLRMGAELAWLANSRDLLKIAVSKLKDAQRRGVSTRSQGYLYYAEALSASANGSPKQARELIEQALTIWRDVANLWAAGEIYAEARMFREAAARYVDVASAKATALRFDAVGLWVESLARAAWSLEQVGQAGEALKYRSQFERLWGSSSAFHFGRAKASHQS